MLIIALPHTAQAAATGYAHVHSDGQNVLRSATGVAATLSHHAGEVVAVVPYGRLAWLRVQLPPASHGPRLPSVLQGLLEERLLDEPQQLHLVLDPQAHDVARTGGPAWVAVCDKAWLREALAPLQAAGLVVQRLVPECSPSDTPVLQVMGEPGFAHHVLCHAQGVTLLPPSPASWGALADSSPDTWQIHAEPAVVAHVQASLQRQPTLQSQAQRWLTSSQSAWDLAQGEWAQGRAQRLQRWGQSAWQSLMHAPAWRPVRIGVTVWVALQVVGLNGWAWREQSAWRTQQASLETILKATFPSVTLVVDAPLQMQREVTLLQEKSGTTTSTDLEPLLAALAAVLPAGQTPTQLQYANRALRLQGVTPDSASAGMARLTSQGLKLRQDGQDTWVLEAKDSP